jgi:hypothetical protein
VIHPSNDENGKKKLHDEKPGVVRQREEDREETEQLERDKQSG